MNGDMVEIQSGAAAPQNTRGDRVIPGRELKREEAWWQTTTPSPPRGHQGCNSSAGNWSFPWGPPL